MLKEKSYNTIVTGLIITIQKQKIVKLLYYIFQEALLFLIDFSSFNFKFLIKAQYVFRSEIHAVNTTVDYISMCPLFSIFHWSLGLISIFRSTLGVKRTSISEKLHCCLKPGSFAVILSQHIFHIVWKTLWKMELEMCVSNIKLWRTFSVWSWQFIAFV